MLTNKSTNLSGWEKFRCLEAKQPGGTLYTVVIKGKKLVSKSTVLARAIGDEGIQRLRSDARCRRIAKFYAMDDCLLPGNILGTISKENIRIEDGYIYLSPDFVNEVIDGQHRLWGFDPQFNEENADFDIILTFLLNADVKMKAKQFYKINREQKKINPSLAYDLLIVMEDTEMKGEVARVVKQLSEDTESPFCGIIKIRENDTGMISMASTAHKIEQLLKGPIGKRFFKGKGDVNSNTLYETLKNYFTTVRNLFPKQWSDSECILVKTLGYGAFIELLPDVIAEHTLKNGRTIPSVKQLTDIMKPIDSFDFYDSEVTSLGGEKGQRYLAQLLGDEMGFEGFEDTGD